MGEFKIEKTSKKLIPVMLMAYKENGTLDFDGLNSLTDFYLKAGSSALFTNCYSTEMYNLTCEERLKNAVHVVKRVNGKVPVIAVGTFGESIKENAEAIKMMYDTGVDTVIMVSSKIVTPQENDSDFLQNLELILSLTEGIPLGIYECPLPYKRIVSPDIYKFLCDSGRIIYHKDTSCNLNSVREKLSITNGSAIEFYDAHMPNAVESLRLGATGISAIAANFFPEILTWICENFNVPEKQDDIEFIENEMKNIDNYIHEYYPVNAKHFLKLRGVNISSSSRYSKNGLSEQSQQSLFRLLQTFHFWCERLGIDVDK